MTWAEQQAGGAMRGGVPLRGAVPLAQGTPQMGRGMAADCCALRPPRRPALPPPPPLARLPHMVARPPTPHPPTPAPQYGDLLRGSGLPPPQLRAGLLVLLQHNYVDVYLKEEPPTLRGPGPSYSLYEAALPRILQILRWVLAICHFCCTVRVSAQILAHRPTAGGCMRRGCWAEAGGLLEARRMCSLRCPPSPQIDVQVCKVPCFLTHIANHPMKTRP